MDSELKILNTVSIPFVLNTITSSSIFSLFDTYGKYTINIGKLLPSARNKTYRRGNV